jgi:nucleoside-diphosphate-sugar epimerase
MFKRKILIIGEQGYIGSHLNRCLPHQIRGVDIGWFSLTRNPLDYKNLTKGYLSNYDVIILLAGHSSVRMCENDMISSFRNNVVNFVELLDKIDDQKFIYMSSSSVCSSMRDKSEGSDTFEPVNHYDLSKYVIDQYAKLSGKRFYGLRLGTVNGWSTVVRSDIMINAMVNSAWNNKCVKMFNGDIHRPILGINDLGSAIRTIIEKDGEAGIYNLASFNATVREIATTVADILGVELVEEELETANKSKPYDYTIDSSKFMKEFDFKFDETIETIVKSFGSDYIYGRYGETQWEWTSRHYKVEYE